MVVKPEFDAVVVNEFDAAGAFAGSKKRVLWSVRIVVADPALFRLIPIVVFKHRYLGTSSYTFMSIGPPSPLSIFSSFYC